MGKGISRDETVIWLGLAIGGIRDARGQRDAAALRIRDTLGDLRGRAVAVSDHVAPRVTVGISGDPTLGVGRVLLGRAGLGRRVTASGDRVRAVGHQQEKSKQGIKQGLHVSILVPSSDERAALMTQHCRFWASTVAVSKFSRTHLSIKRSFASQAVLVTRV